MKSVIIFLLSFLIAILCISNDNKIDDDIDVEEITGDEIDDLKDDENEVDEVDDEKNRPKRSPITSTRRRITDTRRRVTPATTRRRAVTPAGGGGGTQAPQPTQASKENSLVHFYSRILLLFGSLVAFCFGANLFGAV